MDASQGPQLIWGVVMLVLVTSSLFAQRMPIGQFLRYAIIWAAIFAGIYGLVLFRNELGEVWARAKADLTGEVAAEVQGSTTRIRQSGDGHFRVVANVEGREFEFLIDSGATSSFLSDQAAGDLAKLDAKQGLPIVVQTANGPINSWPVEVAGITVGSVRMEPFQMNVSDGGADVNILGMNWLNRLKSWRVERGVMTIEP
jgi:aspartyl protease family protein